MQYEETFDSYMGSCHVRSCYDACFFRIRDERVWSLWCEAMWSRDVRCVEGICVFVLQIRY